jgi:hypothetical protein
MSFVAYPKELGEPIFATPGGGVIKGGTQLLKYAAAGIGGLILGRALGGSQEVTPTQTTVTTPTQAPEQRGRLRTQQFMRDFLSRMRATQKVDVTPTVTPDIRPAITPTYDIQAGGDVDIGGITETTTILTETHTQTGLSQTALGQLTEALLAQRQEPQQITIVTPEQKTTAVSADMSGLIIIALAAVAAMILLKK